MDRRNQGVPQDQVAVHRRTDEKHRSGDSPDPLASATDGNQQFHTRSRGENMRPPASLSIVKEVRSVHQSSGILAEENFHVPVVGVDATGPSTICSATQLHQFCSASREGKMETTRHGPTSFGGQSAGETLWKR